MSEERVYSFSLKDLEELERNMKFAEYEQENSKIKTSSFECLNATVFLPRGLPAGFDLMCEKSVLHPNGERIGALVKNRDTGIYQLYSGTYFSNVPQDWAAERAANGNKKERELSNNKGG